LLPPPNPGTHSGETVGATSTPIATDRQSGIRYRASCRTAERIARASLPQRDSSPRELSPLVSDLTSPARAYFTAREFAIGLLIALPLGALGAWLVSTMRWMQ
jgi:hypothetical protein